MNEEYPKTPREIALEAMLARFIDAGMSDLIKRGLPKWPQLLLYGRSIKPEQALEIIRVTDTFFTWSGGNNHRWNTWVRSELGMIPEDAVYDLKKVFPADDEKGINGIDFDAYCAWKEKWNAAWGRLETNYLDNSWISSSFIFGAHGWCHPDGKLFYCYNIGKWPSIPEVLGDFATIAAAFPFLDFGATLYNGESSDNDKKPVISFRIKDGRVELVDPDVRDVFAEFLPSGANGLEALITEALSDERMMRRFTAQAGDNDPEIGVDPEVIIGWGRKYRDKLPPLPALKGGV